MFWGDSLFQCKSSEEINPLKTTFFPSHTHINSDRLTKTKLKTFYSFSLVYLVSSINCQYSLNCFCKAWFLFEQKYVFTSGRSQFVEINYRNPTLPTAQYSKSPLKAEAQVGNVEVNPSRQHRKASGIDL